MEYLKKQNPNIQVIEVESKDSPVLTEKNSGPHKIQGIGAGFIPDILNIQIYDETITVTNEDALSTGKKF